MLDDYLTEILSICASEFDVTVSDVLGKSKKQELVYCRKAFCVIAKESLDVKLNVMAGKLNRSVNAVSSFISNQPDNKYYNVCLRQIKSRVKPFG